MKKGIMSAILASTIMTSAYAATQGALVHGTDTSITSEGSLDVLLQIDYAIQVNKLNDIDFGSFQAGLMGTQNKGDRFCVFTNAQSFNVTFISANASGVTPQLKSINNPSLLIPYELYLGKIDLTKSRYTLNQVDSGETTTNITEVRNQVNCQMDLGSGSSFYPNLVVRAKIEENDLLDAVPDSYKDTVTVIASPE